MPGNMQEKLFVICCLLAPTLTECVSICGRPALDNGSALAAATQLACCALSPKHLPTADPDVSLQRLRPRSPAPPRRQEEQQQQLLAVRACVCL